MTGRDVSACRYCGPNRWTPCPHDLECPDCHARPGAWCKRPSGHKAQEIHLSRIQLVVQTWTPEQLAIELAWEREHGDHLVHQAAGIPVPRDTAPVGDGQEVLFA